tara:strand:+ start:527 stop:763 length:237 start_codon:yes stop_codon:yes gene_type:complete
MQYMNSVQPTDYVENSERAVPILDPDLPNAAADTGERFAMHRLFAQVQQKKFTANVDTDRPWKSSDDIQRVAMPVNIL